MKPAEDLPLQQETYMNRYDNFERLLREVQLINDEIKKNWSSDSAGIFCSFLDDSVQYMKKVTEGCRDELEKSDSGRSSLSGFSF